MTKTHSFQVRIIETVEEDPSDPGDKTRKRTEIGRIAIDVMRSERDPIRRQHIDAAFKAIAIAVAEKLGAS